MKNRTALQTAVAAALLLGSATAMADGRLEGRVVAADQSTALEGASVRIESLDRTVTTQRDGRFSFGQLPAGSYSVTVSYLGAPSETQSVIIAEDTTASVDITLGRSMDEIVVHGIRGGNARALNLQRNSNTFVSIVSADAIGQLPEPKRGTLPFDAYTTYYVGQALYQVGGDDWRDNYAALRDYLVASQLADPNNPAVHGSWRDNGANGGGKVGGRPGELFGTSVACFILAIPNRYLPILQEGKIESLRNQFGK